jgi:hypothetical protein
MRLGAEFIIRQAVFDQLILAFIILDCVFLAKIENVNQVCIRISQGIIDVYLLHMLWCLPTRF